jgi:tetratricopeptide (TPR) repeat protein
MAQLKWDEADVAFRRALALNPSDAASHVWLGQWQVQRGHLQEGLASARRAVALDPLSVRTTVLAAFTMGMAGALEEQGGHLRAALAIRPDYFQAHFLLGLNLVSSPDTLAEGVTYLEKAVASSGRSPQIVAGLARAYALAGRRDEARRLADEVLARKNEEAASPLAVAAAYMVKDDREDALRALEAGFRARSRGIHQLPRTNWFRELEDDPRYRDLVARVLAG